MNLPRRTYYYKPKAIPSEEALIDRIVIYVSSSHGMAIEGLPNSFSVRDGSSTTKRWPGSCARTIGHVCRERNDGLAQQTVTMASRSTQT
jgi:hypothetical protein